MSTLRRVERRLLGEYLDLPNLSLSLAQAVRLSSADRPVCEVVLNDLVRSRYLARRASGTYVRAASFSDLDRWKRAVENRLAAAGRAGASPGGVPVLVVNDHDVLSGAPAEDVLQNAIHHEGRSRSS